MVTISDGEPEGGWLCPSCELFLQVTNRLRPRTSFYHRIQCKLPLESQFDILCVQGFNSTIASSFTWFYPSPDVLSFYHYWEQWRGTGKSHRWYHNETNYKESIERRSITGALFLSEVFLPVVLCPADSSRLLLPKFSTLSPQLWYKH